MELTLKHGMMLIDNEDAAILGNRTITTDSGGYARVMDNGRLETAHRLVMGLALGDRRQVDHINGNRLDNRRCNLRVCTARENRRNAKKRKDNTSGYKGVIRVRRPDGRDEWRAVLAVGGFVSAEEAAHVYDTMAGVIYGEYALLNFPPSGESSDSK
jgi:hypothetical protein